LGSVQLLILALAGLVTAAFAVLAGLAITLVSTTGRLGTLIGGRTAPSWGGARAVPGDGRVAAG
jgi:hypothetical protein